MYKFIQFSFLFMLLRFFWAYWVPFGNDEAYYWDWSRSLMLSYYDHPPMVAWVGKLGSLLLSDYSFHSRALVPVLHFLISILLCCITQNLSQKSSLSRSQYIAMFLMIQLAPIFSWGGVFLLPDIGLIFWVVLAVYIGIKILFSKDASVWAFIFWGVCAGMALNSKYHALVIMPFLYVYVWVKSYQRNHAGLFALAFLVACIVSAPLWVWNSQNDWVSFSFQTAHCFSGMNIDMIRGFRVIFAQLLLVSPFIFVSFFMVSLQGSKLQYGSLLRWLSVPLWVLLMCLAFVKEVLPHWVLVSYILSLPLIVLRVESISKYCKINFWVFGSLCLLVPFLAGSVTVTDFVSTKFLNSRPAGMGEITLWKKLKPIIDQEIKKTVKVNRSNCHQKIMMGSFRWWWTAQLSLLYPGHKLFNFDHKISFYDFRDKGVLEQLKGCPIMLVGQRKYYSSSRLSKYLSIQSKKNIAIPLHNDRESVIVHAIIL